MKLLPRAPGGRGGTKPSHDDEVFGASPLLSPLLLLLLSLISQTKQERMELNGGGMRGHVHCASPSSSLWERVLRIVICGMRREKNERAK